MGAIVIGDRNLHIRRHLVVATSLSDEGDHLGVVLVIVVVRRGHRHHLHFVPLGRTEGQGGLVQGQVAVHVTVHAHGDHARRLHGERHHVGGLGAFRDHQCGGHDRQSGLVIVGDSHRHLGGHRAVAGSAGGDGVGNGRGAHSVRIIDLIVHGLHGHRLRGVPIRRLEGETRRLYRGSRGVGAGQIYYHLGGRTAGQSHLVGAGSVRFREGQRGR